MQYIKVLATDSTNAALKTYYRNSSSITNTCLSATHQKKGSGQKGTSWETEDGKNLTFSLLLQDLNLDIDFSFKISALVSLAVSDFAQQKLPDQKVKIKWPNDILADNFKIAGILIENFLRKNKIHTSIIGIGLNINQTFFKDLPRAGSFKMFTHKNYNLEELLPDLAEQIEKKVYDGIHTPLSEILKKYESHLFRINKVSTFQFPDGNLAKGKIKGIQPSGKLWVEFEGTQKEFDIKEIKLVY